MNIHYNMAGVFTVKKFKKGNLKQELRFKNLITDHGLNQLGRRPVLTGQYSAGTHLGTLPRFMFSRLALGDGTNPPLPTDLHLQNERLVLNANPTTDIVWGNDQLYPLKPAGERGHYIWTRSEWRLATGTGPYSFTEVGVGPTDEFSVNALWSRQLFKDENGNPITVEKELDEELFITYELRVFAPVETVVSGGPVTIAGTQYNTHWYPVWNTWGFDMTFSQLQQSTANPAPANPVPMYYSLHNLTQPLYVPVSPTLTARTAATSRAWSAYVDGSFERSVTMVWNRQSFAGQDIRAIGVPGIFSVASPALPQWIMGVTPDDDGPDAFGKSGDEQLTMTFKHSWNRVSETED